jgi:hypothetical protein
MHRPSKPHSPPENNCFLVTNCTKERPVEFNLEYDYQVMYHPEPLIVSSMSTTELHNNLLNSVPYRIKT